MATDEVLLASHGPESPARAVFQQGRNSRRSADTSEAMRALDPAAPRATQISAGESKLLITVLIEHSAGGPSRRYTGVRLLARSGGGPVRLEIDDQAFGSLTSARERRTAVEFPARSGTTPSLCPPLGLDSGHSHHHRRSEGWLGRRRCQLSGGITGQPVAMDFESAP